MTTGDAFTGSSTPPTCAAAERCTRAPTCAHEPTSACESIIVPAPTHAPTLTYIGGMQTTPAARCAPRLTAEPPGTSLTPSSGENRRGGIAALSVKPKLVCIGIATTEETRKASNIARFTQGTA